MSSPFLIFGAGGQLGNAFAALLGNKARVLSAQEADFAAPEAVLALVESLPKPQAIINAAAYTAVDKCEEEEALALRINAETPALLARYCAEQQIPFMHYSTDYVFPGSGTAPFQETDATGPLNAYGRTKLAGEQGIMAAGGHSLIFRTSWVYDATGKNFVNTMLRLGKEREMLTVVADQIGAPTYADDLAKYSFAALEKAMAMPVFPSGIYHLCGHGETSWHGFAEAIFRLARARGMALKVQQVQPILSSAYLTPAKRPLNSRLSMQQFETTFGIAMPHWETSLTHMMESIR